MYAHLKSPLVSIVMPSHNTGRFIADAIRSVIAQTYTNWELLIVDDHSIDNTKEVVDKVIQESQCAYKIRVFYNESLQGAALTRNRAIREAKGRFIAFLDSDDLWTSRKLGRQVAFMLKNGYAFTYTKYGEMNEDGEPLGVEVSGPHSVGKCLMYGYCWPGCLTVMYDREVVGEVQVADIKKNNDYAMWLKVVQKARCHLLPENHACYRHRNGSISHDGNTKVQGLTRYLSLVKWHYYMFRFAERMNPVRSVILTAGNLAYGVCKKIQYVKHH